MQTKIRDAQKSVPHFVLFIFLAISSTGCTTWQLAKRTLHTELQQYPRVTEGKRSNRQYMKWARKEWKRYAANHPGETHSADYVSGFMRGFTQYVYAGGNTDPPAMAPRKYWQQKYRSPGGDKATQDWYNGYSHGANTAKDNGYRERATVPSSLLLGYNKGIENRYADHSAGLESGAQEGDDDTPIGDDALERLMNEGDEEELLNEDDPSESLFDPDPLDSDPDPLDSDPDSFEEMPAPDLDSSSALPSTIDQVSFLTPERRDENLAVRISTSTKTMSASLSSDIDDGTEQPTPADPRTKPKSDGKPAVKEPLNTNDETEPLKASPSASETKGFSFELTGHPPVPPWDAQSDASPSDRPAPSILQPSGLLEPVEPTNVFPKSTELKPETIPQPELKAESARLHPKKETVSKQADSESELTLVGPMKPTKSLAWSDVSTKNEKSEQSQDTSTSEPQWQARD